MNALPCEAADLAAIGAQVLAGGARLRFRARGSSMFPLIRDGDILVVEPADPAQLRVGDVVLFQSAGASVLAHRLVRVEQDAGQPWLTMRGDARPGPDQPVGPAGVLGRVVAIERRGRARSITRGWRARLGWLMARLPAPLARGGYRALCAYRGWKRARRVRGRQG